MTAPPEELATYKGGELCQYLQVFCIDRDGEIRGSERVWTDKLFKAASVEQLNRADVYYALRCMFERINLIGGGDRTVQDLISTVRNALKEAAITRAANGQPAEATNEPEGSSGEDIDPGPRRAFGR
jgi:hypothetical protein